MLTLEQRLEQEITELELQTIENGILATEQDIQMLENGIAITELDLRMLELEIGGNNE